jgi:hypothetical protein
MLGRASKGPLRVILHSGLGNQMFQYAAAKALAVEHGCDLLIDTVTGFKGDPYGRRYELGAFRLSARQLPGPCLKAGSLWPRLIFWATRKMETAAMRWWGCYYLPWLQKTSLRCAGMVFGYWQSPRYFESVDVHLREEFRLKEEPSSAVRQWLERLRGSHSAVVHVRLRHAESDGGEVVSPKLADSDRLEALLGYYRVAVVRLRAKVENPQWLVVSDSAQFDPRRLELPSDTPVVGPCLERSPAEDLWLISQARHKIIGPSSFGWWGAWLSPQESGLVLVPQVFRPGGSRRPSRGVYPPGWVTLGGSL